MSTPKELGSALVESLSTDSVTELVKEYAELGIDAALVNGLLRDLPVVNTIVALGKLGISINDRILIRKLLKFLAESQDMTAQERRVMVQKLEMDPEYGRKVGEHLIELLERIDSQRKPAMVSRVFKAYANSEINAGMLHRLNHAVEQLPHFEISIVRRFRDIESKERLGLGSNSLQALVYSGLATVGSGWGALVYEPSDVCEAFLRLRLDDVQT